MTLKMKQYLKVTFLLSLSSLLLTLFWWLFKGQGQGLHQQKSSTSAAWNMNLLLRLQTHDVSAKENLMEKKENPDVVNKIMNASNYKEALSKVVNKQQDVIISVVDYSLREFALNLYISSVRKLKFKNHLFICADHKSMQYLNRHSIACYLYNTQFLYQEEQNQTTKYEENSSDFGSSSYHTMTNLKTRVVLDALIYGFNVLICDLDIIVIQDPFPYFTCNNCDIHVSKDRELFNSGFLYARSTKHSVKLYQLAWDFYKKYHKSHDQSYINMALRVLLNSDVSPKISIQELSSKQFPCGYYYFRSDFRMFNNTPKCADCVIIHNNYIGSAAAKKYRFKENLLWYVDSLVVSTNIHKRNNALQSSYYSDPNLKLISFDNPRDFGHNTYKMELQALKNAMIIGNALNRTVILPTFRCCDCKTEKCEHPRHKCSLLSLLKLNSFDKQYSGDYREHVFLLNTLVNKKVTQGTRVNLHLNITSTNALVKNLNFDTKALNVDYQHFRNQTNLHLSSSKLRNIKRTNALNWLRTFEDATLLHFEALYGDFVFMLSPKEEFYFNQHSSQSFQCSDYDQWEVENNWF